MVTEEYRLFNLKIDQLVLHEILECKKMYDNDISKNADSHFNLRDVVLNDLYRTTSHGIKVMNVDFFYDILSILEKHNSYSRKKITDSIALEIYKEFDDQESNEEADNFMLTFYNKLNEISIQNKEKFNASNVVNSKLFDDLNHLSALLNIKKMKSTSKIHNVKEENFDKILNNTLDSFQYYGISKETRLISEKGYVYSHFNSLINGDKNKAYTVFKTLLINSNLSHYEKCKYTNQDVCYHIIDIYTTSLKLLKIHNEINDILSNLKKYRGGKKDLDFTADICNENVVSYFKFSNIFQQKQLLLFLILLFSVRLDVKFEQMRKVFIQLFMYENRGSALNIRVLESNYSKIKGLKNFIEILNIEENS